MKMTQLLLGRPFLATSKALIDVDLREIVMRFNDEFAAYTIYEEALVS